MSFNIRNIREISTDPSTKFVSHLAKKISDFANAQQTQELENKEDIYSSGQDVDSVLRFHTLISTKRFTFTTEYYPPTEPDLDKLTMWLQGRNTGTKTRDLSGFNNDNSIWGDPILIDGTPFNYGIHTGNIKSTALRFNRVTTELDHSTLHEHIAIDSQDAHNKIKIKDSTSISWFFRVRVFATDTNGGKRRTIYCKIDNTGASIAAINDAIRVSIDPVNKRWVIQIKNNDTFYSKETGINKFLENTVYDAFITFNTGTIKLYLAKTGDSTMTDETLSNSGYTEEWSDDLSSTGARLFKRGPHADDGVVYGDLYDFKVYRNYTITSTDANRHWTNKWTIADIPFGQVMITDYYATYIEDGIGYDATGYDATGYDTV